MLRHPALSAIWAYQRYVSPRKGFGCAYRLAHGGTGCSGYAKGVIAEHGTLRAIPLMINRFAACKRAALALADEQAKAQTKTRGKGTTKSRRSRWCDRCDCLTACMPCGGGGFGKTKTPDGGSDCTPDCTPDCCGG